MRTSKKTIKYGLRIKKSNKILGYNKRSNEGKDFCNDTTTTLSEYEDNFWSVDDPMIAEYVRNFSTEWYNASYETPIHYFKPNELEVVKLEIITNTETLNIEIPTIKEYISLKYKESEPSHYKYMMEKIKKHKDVKYSLYDLQVLISKGIWKPSK